MDSLIIPVRKRTDYSNNRRNTKNWHVKKHTRGWKWILPKKIRHHSNGYFDHFHFYHQQQKGVIVKLSENLYWIQLNVFAIYLAIGWISCSMWMICHIVGDCRGQTVQIYYIRYIWCLIVFRSDMSKQVFDKRNTTNHYMHHRLLEVSVFFPFDDFFSFMFFFTTPWIFDIAFRLIPFQYKHSMFERKLGKNYME